MTTMNDYCREKFDKKLYKLSLDGGFTCPNRDGTKGRGGCIFCSASGSGDFAQGGDNIYEQIEKAKERVKEKNKNGGYIAYFQSFTSTYAPVEKLRKMFYEAISHPEVEVLSVATRPDCLPDDVVELLGELNGIKPVWVELGLQTSKQETVEYIRRCFSDEDYISAVKRLHEKGIYVITHMIIGLPGESISDMENTLSFITENRSDGIKLQLLHILRDAPIYEDYINGRVSALSREEYLYILSRLIPMIPPYMTVHRLTGDGNKKTLAAPLWSGDKKSVLNSINKLISDIETEAEYIFREIEKEEISLMFSLILSRMSWMDRVGIKQWNVTHYDTVYPMEYYEKHRKMGEVFGLFYKKSGQLAAVGVLKHSDDRWDEKYINDKAVYLHNFASSEDYKGAGSIFLKKAEEYARTEGVEYFRLDSADDNKALEKYYEKRGYTPQGSCIDGPYRGILRQKKLQKHFPIYK